MRSGIYWQLAVIIIVLIRGTVGVTGVSHDEQPEYAPGIVLVGVEDGLPVGEISFFQLGFAAKSMVNEQLAAINTLAVRVPVGEEDDFIASALTDPRVTFAERDYRVHVDRLELDSFARIPNDPYYASQWSLGRIGSARAWDYNIGSAEVMIATIDSGIQLNHPDLAAKIWSNPGEIPSNAIDDDGNGKIDDVHGWHFYHEYTATGYVPAEDSLIADDMGHGTHVAGIAAAASNNGVGIAGIAWGSTILPVKVIDKYGSGWYSDIAAGIIYAVNNGARVINLSVGGEQPAQTLKASVDYAVGRGAIVLAAAGNTGKAVLYPAAYDNVTAVAATDSLDLRASYSNYGPAIDLAAPGTEIYSSWYRSNYFTLSGTSMAAPHVSGLVALMVSQRANLTQAQIVEVMCDSAEDIGPAGKDIYTGCGRIDAGEAMQRISEPETKPYRLIFPVMFKR